MSPEEKTIDTAQNGTSAESSTGKSPNRAWQNVKREMSEETLSNPDIGKLLLNENDELRYKVAELQDFQAKYYEEHRQVGILEERLVASSSATNSKVLLMTFGGVVLGLLPSLWGKQYIFWPAGLAAIVAFLIALIKKR